MLEMKNDTLVFAFPEVHPDARCEITFVRTLRIPDDGKTYPLPPGLGNFPLKHVDDHKANLSEDTVKRGGVLLPMYQSEALWVKFDSKHLYEHGAKYPFAVKISAGKRSAITGNAWKAYGLAENDYVVIPVQPWIDGFLISEGMIRQFVASPLGMGFTVEEQLTSKAEFGGIQIEVFPMKREEFEKRHPKRTYSHSVLRRGTADHYFGLGEVTLCDTGSMGGVTATAFNCCAPVAASAASTEGDLRITRSLAVSSMGMAAGGQMKQEIHPDPYGMHVWDTSSKSRTFVHLLNSLAWEGATGQKPPHAPANANLYKRYALPWYEWYSDAGALKPTDQTAQIKSVTQLSHEKGYTILPDNQTITVEKTTPLYAPKTPFTVKDGSW